jgi:hypothetical protein
MIILIALCVLIVALGFCAAEAWYERDWPRDMVKFAFYAFLILAFALNAFGQNVRYDAPFASTTGGSGQQLPVYALPFATIKFYACTGSTCTTLASTYSSASSTTACPVSPATQVVLQGTTACVGQADSEGNFGAWFQPGQYAYTIAPQYGGLYGPILFTIGVGAGGGTSITVNGTAVSSPANFANSSGNGAITVSNPSGNNVLGTLTSPFSIINGVNCPLGSAGCTVPTGFPITLGSTAIAASSTTTALTGLSVNGVNLTTADASTTYLNGAGAYTTPSGSSGSFIQTNPSATQGIATPSGANYFETNVNTGIQSSVAHSIATQYVGQGFDLGNPWHTFNTFNISELNLARGNNQIREICRLGLPPS